MKIPLDGFLKREMQNSRPPKGGTPTRAGLGERSADWKSALRYWPQAFGATNVSSRKSGFQPPSFFSRRRATARTS